MQTGERVSCGRTGDQPRCFSCRHWEVDEPGANLAAREHAITARYGDYAGLGGRCLAHDRGAMSKGWCGEWERATRPPSSETTDPG